MISEIMPLAEPCQQSAQREPVDFRLCGKTALYIYEKFLLRNCTFKVTASIQQHRFIALQLTHGLM